MAGRTPAAACKTGGPQPLRVWQYSVSDGNGALKSAQGSGSRRIVRFTEQNHRADQDVIVWRLVGIVTAPKGASPAKDLALNAKARISAK